MNASYVQRGEYIDVVPENDVKAGDIVVRGRLVGVSKLDIKAGTLGALATTGVYDVAKGGVPGAWLASAPLWPSLWT